MYFIKASADGARSRRAERNDGFARKVNTLQESKHDARNFAPPDGITQVNSVIARNIRHRSIECGSIRDAILLTVGAAIGVVVNVG